MDWCARLFAEPEAVCDAIARPLTAPLEVMPHAHRDMLQLALLRRCAGRVHAGGRWAGVSGTTAMAAYPGDRHGYELRPAAGSAEIVLIKLRCAPTWPVSRARPFPSVATAISESGRLAEALDRLRRDVTPVGGSMPSWVADAAAVVCAWPRGDQPAPMHAAGEEGDPAVQAALGLVEDRIGDPPSLAEMASVAHLSTRQFCRRFERAVGRSPHEYVSQRRLERAKAMLFDDRLSGAAIAEALGFSSPATFTRWFRQRVGKTPMQFRGDPMVM
ncbi:MAG: AraC family transcriptional regulator [Planctomycetota bacterium]